MLVEFLYGAGMAEDAIPHDGDAVANPEEFRKVAADHQDPAGVAGWGVPIGEAIQPLVDALLRPDINPAGGFVQEEEVGFHEQEPGQRNFLLISPGKLGHLLVGRTAANPEGFDPLACRFLGRCRGKQAVAGQSMEAWKAEVLSHGQVCGQPLARPVFAQETGSVFPAMKGRAGPGEPLDVNLPSGEGVQSEQGSEKGCAAGAHETGDADDFPPVNLE